MRYANITASIPYENKQKIKENLLVSRAKPKTLLLYKAREIEITRLSRHFSRCFSQFSKNHNMKFPGFSGSLTILENFITTNKKR